MRSLTRWFQLVNLAEDNERVRRLRARDAADPERRARARCASRRGAAPSRRDGAMDQLQTVLDNAELRLVMTAHPTEARRRTTIDKLARVFGVLRELDERSPTPDRRRPAPAAGHRPGAVGLRRPPRRRADRLDEVRGGPRPLLLDAGRRDPADLPRPRGGGRRVLPGRPRTARPRCRRCSGFGSWIGGDRDGNPFVTPETTVAALELMREQCLRLLEAAARAARRAAVAVRAADRPAPPGSSRSWPPACERFPELAQRLAGLEPGGALPARADVHARARPRHARPRPPALRRARGAACRSAPRRGARCVEGHGALTAGADLRDFIRQVEVFGFHFARLDIREHARVHRRALAEIYGAARRLRGLRGPVRATSGWRCCRPRSPTGGR